MDIEALREVADRAAEENGLFVLEIKSRPGNVFSIFLDGDEFATLDKLKKVNRNIDAAFDREEEDFSLEVSSPGASEPLVIPRQYSKHLGKQMQIVLTDGQKFKGELSDVSEDKIELTWKERVPKEIGKGKRTVELKQSILFKEIAKAKRTVNFNG